MKLVSLLYYTCLCFIFFWSPIIGTIFCICLCCWKFRDLFKSKGLLYFFSLCLNDCTKWLQAVSGRHEEWREWRSPVEKVVDCLWSANICLAFGRGKFHENMCLVGLFLLYPPLSLIPESSCITCILLGRNCNPGPLWASSSDSSFPLKVMSHSLS